MKCCRLVCLIAACAAALISCTAPRQAEVAAPSQTVLQPGWNRIAGGDATKCALGGDYAFFARAGDPHKLMIYFQGGGACWNGLTCNLRGRAIYKATVNERERPYGGGLLDMEHSENPVAGYTAVFVPYCTGDVHLGSRTADYTIPALGGDSARHIRIFHYGATNVAAALNWAFAYVTAPEIVLVAGESAGSIPTPFYAARVAQRYPRARVVQLGDASGAYQTGAVMFGTWGVGALVRTDNAFRSVDSASTWFTQLYKLAPRASKRLALAQVNSAEDTTQAFFVRAALRDTAAVKSLLSFNYADIQNAIPGFRSYTMPGSRHAILPRPEFYTTTVDGVRLRDWVAALVAGKTPADVGASLLSARPSP